MALLLIALPLGLAACTVPAAPALKRGVADFSSTDLSNTYHYEQYRYDGGVFCGFYQYASLYKAPPNRLVVGYNNVFQPGSGPFPCIFKIDHAYRGGVRFDLSSLVSMKQIVIEKAVLTWTIERAYVSDSSGNPRGSKSCVGAVLESSQNIFTQGAFLPGRSLRIGPGDVTSLVTTWIVDKQPNFGFVLVGLDESYPRNNAECVNIIKDLHLHIDFLIP